MSNIPNHKPQPPIPRSRRVFLLVFAFSPVVGYALLKVRQNNIARQRRLDEEEGRRSWIEQQAEQEILPTPGNERDKLRDLSVKVSKSGGGI